MPASVHQSRRACIRGQEVGVGCIRGQGSGRTGEVGGRLGGGGASILTPFPPQEEEK